MSTAPHAPTSWVCSVAFVARRASAPRRTACAFSDNKTFSATNQPLYVGRPNICTLAHALLWEHGSTRPMLAQLPGQRGVFLTFTAAAFAGAGPSLRAATAG